MSGERHNGAWPDKLMRRRDRRANVLTRREEEAFCSSLCAHARQQLDSPYYCSLLSRAGMDRKVNLKIRTKCKPTESRRKASRNSHIKHDHQSSQGNAANTLCKFVLDGRCEKNCRQRCRRFMKHVTICMLKGECPGQASMVTGKCCKSCF